MQTYQQVRAEMERDGVEMTTTEAEFTAMMERAERDAAAWRSAYRAIQAERAERAA